MDIVHETRVALNWLQIWRERVFKNSYPALYRETAGCEGILEHVAQLKYDGEDAVEEAQSKHKLVMALVMALVSPSSDLRA